MTNKGRVYTIDCSDNTPVVESMVHKDIGNGDYNTSNVGTPPPVLIPGTHFALVATYTYLQVWDVTTKALVSETDMPGDILAFWLDAADPTKAAIPCWGNWDMSTASIYDDTTNTIAMISGLGTGTVSIDSVREVIYDNDQNLVGATTPYADGPGFFSHYSPVASSSSISPSTHTAIETQNESTGKITVAKSDEDLIYDQGGGCSPYGAGRIVIVSGGSTVAEVVTGYESRGLRFYVLDHSTGTPALHIVDAPMHGHGVPETEGVQPQIDFLHAGSIGFAASNTHGSAIVAATVVSNDFAPDPTKESRFTVTASILNSEILPETATLPPPLPQWTTFHTHLLPQSSEGFYGGIHSTDGGYTFVTNGLVSPDADHVLVGSGPNRLDSVDDATTALSVFHLNDTTPTLVLDAPGIRLAPWAVPSTETVVDFIITARITSNDTGYGGGGSYGSQMYLWDAHDLTKPGIKVADQSKPTGVWSTLTNNYGTLTDHNKRVPILDMLARGDLIVAVTVGSAYYVDVTSKVSAVQFTVKTVAAS